MDDYDRRHFIRTSLQGFIGLTMALPRLTAKATEANAYHGKISPHGAIHWEAFLEEVEKEASRQHLDDWNEDTYVERAAAMCSRLNLHDEYLLAAFKNAQRGLANGRVDFEPLEKQRDFHVTLLQFEKNEKIAHHNHPEMTGVILCASGEIETWNYDLLDEKPDRDSLLLRETNHDILRKGVVSTLTSKARNIHALKARELTQLIDIFAPPYDKEKIAASVWYEVDSDSYQPDTRTDKVFLAKKR